MTHVKSATLAREAAPPYHSRMRILLTIIAVLVANLSSVYAATPDSGWRQIPLTTNGKISPDWVHIGFGGWVVEGDTIRTDPAPEGLGLIVYKKEKLGNCQIKVVFKPKEARSNSGFYIRLDDGILKQLHNPGAKYNRDGSGKPSAESTEAMRASAERDDGIWYGVNHGFEVQIAAGGDPLHGTGSIYSLADSHAKMNPALEWHTLVVTLDGNHVDVELDGQHASSFDSETKNLPARKIWYEPKREPKRPQEGYIGLQTHDPQDIVWFKEISVRALAKREKK